MKNWAAVEKFVPGWEKYRDEIANTVDTERLNSIGPFAYQDYLYVLVRGHKPKVMLETGVRHGVSTVMNIAAMVANDAGHLSSCDPCHVNKEAAVERILQLTGYKIPDELWDFRGELSSVALLEYAKTRTNWDMFLHDADHGAANMAFELEFGWDGLVPGGLYVCDDWESCAGAPVHKVFTEFCTAKGVEFFEIGSAAVMKKPR